MTYDNATLAAMFDGRPVPPQYLRAVRFRQTMLRR